MLLCRYSKSSNFDKLGALLVYPLCVILSMIFTGYVAYLIVVSLIYIELNSWLSIILNISSLILGLFLLSFLLKLSYHSLCLEYRKFEISTNGIEVYELDGQNRKFSWEDINDIAISAFQISASRQRYQTVICVFFQKPPSDFITGISRYTYAANKLEQFVVLDYSKSLHDKIVLYSGKRIQDYRGVQIV